MAYFSGEYECKLDAKGRMVLPSRLKASLPVEQSAVWALMRGFEPCLVLYPIMEWKKVFDKVTLLNEFNEEYRSFQRNFLRGNTEVELDGNGRFIIPKTMANYASIDKEVIAIGIGNRIELWNPTQYETYLIKDSKALSQLAQAFLAKNESTDGIS